MTETQQQEHRSVDGYPVEVDKQFWNNDLRVVKVTEVAVHANAYSDTGETHTWHRTNQGSFDTLSGTMRPYGRLVRYFEGKDAEQYAPGASYSEIK
jgi:hypothetical protein